MLASLINISKSYEETFKFDLLVLWINWWIFLQKAKISTNYIVKEQALCY